MDLEDIRDSIPDGQRFRDRVPVNVLRYLDFLNSINAKGTFFVVGRSARAHPDLIQEIQIQGHEIACHSDMHDSLDIHSQNSFYRDLERNVESLMKAGARDIIGFRAPVFSMTHQTRWTYQVMKKLGIQYSSSVLPAKNPLFGWDGFGDQIKTVDGVVEIPMALYPRPFPRIPVAGGIYFRVMPFNIVRSGIKSLFNKGLPVQTYLHPFDIDCDQERFMQPNINENSFYNYLMYVGRRKVLSKLTYLSNKYKFTSYRDYLKDRSMHYE